MTAPTCPRHQRPLTVVEEGVLNGVVVRYWGLCGATVSGEACRYETRTEDSDHVEPDLFGGAA